MTLISIYSNKNIFELIPIIYEFKEQIKRHYIVCDEVDKKEAQKFKKNIDKFKQKNDLSFDNRVITIDEDSKSELKNIASFFKEENLYLNATNADTSLLVVFSGFVIAKGGAVISYDKFENSYNLISKTDFTNHKITYNMNIDSFITLLGYKIEGDTSIDKVIDKKEAIYTLFKDFGKLFKLRRNFYNLINLYKSYRSQIDALIELKVIDKNLKPIQDITYFGYLFELFIALELSKYNFDDLKVNAQIIFEVIEENQITNEFDIIAIKDNHIYTFECKLVKAKNLKPIDIIYKADSLLSHFGEDSKGMIINFHPNVDNSFSFNKQSKLRAKINNIVIYNGYQFSFKKFENTLNSFFKIQKRLFLLGGKDLEMITIKSLLVQYNQEFLDKNLSWYNANLSEYKEYFNNKQCFYAIELKVDTSPPSCFVLIDHHNEMQGNPSSLEQVVNILNLKLTRFGKLVALNDSGYIDAMQKFGASKDEIEEIRAKDRAAQGVTPKDEALAKESIKEAKEIKDIIVIKSKTNKFSPIIDRLYGKNVLIYTDSDLTYYGRDIKKLIDEFQKELNQNIAYYGGGFGFFGIDLKNYPNLKLKEYIDKILKLLGATNE